MALLDWIRELSVRTFRRAAKCPIRHGRNDDRI